MPIVNTNIAETTNITQNGTYDVARYTTAVVNTPAAPDYFVGYTKESNNIIAPSSIVLSMFNDVTKVYPGQFNFVLYKNQDNITVPDFSHIEEIGYIPNNLPGTSYGVVNGGSFVYSFADSNVSGSVDLSGIKTVNSAFAFACAFYNCPNITSVKMCGPVKFSSYISDAGGYIFYNCFAKSGITSVDLSELKYIYSNMPKCAFGFMFSECLGLTSVNYSNLECWVGGGSWCGQSMFQGCSNITQAYMPKLKICGGQACGLTFQDCSITSFTFPMLYKAGGQFIFNSMFKNNPITELYFPALIYVKDQVNYFGYQMLNGVTSCTVHFSTAVQSDLSSATYILNGFSGTNTTVLFDIISSITTNSKTYTRYSMLNKGSYDAWYKDGATVTLSDGYTYERYINSDVYDIGKQMVMFAWKQQGGSTVRYTDTLEIDAQTPYYNNSSSTTSSGTITSFDYEIVYTSTSYQPQVNDAVYSDEGITQIGTISAIA